MVSVALTLGRLLVSCPFSLHTKFNYVAVLCVVSAKSGIIFPTACLQPNNCIRTFTATIVQSTIVQH